MSSNPLEDDPKREHRIRERAYHLWKADGEPHGRDAEYWERARELIGMAESAGAGQISPVADAAHRINGQIVDEAALEENLGEFPGRQTDQGERQMAPSRKAPAVASKAMAPAKKSAAPAPKAVTPAKKATAQVSKAAPAAEPVAKAAATPPAPAKKAAEPVAKVAAPVRKAIPAAAPKAAAAPALTKPKPKGKKP
jgi:hypothetical protein